MVLDNSKEQIIVAIRSLNATASREFLSQFSEADLREYLGNLQGSRRSYRTFTAAPKQDRQPAGVGGC
jgi:hypothetical protein